MKTTLRRLQQLEHHRSALLIANDYSGAKDELLRRLERIRERLKGNPNWTPSPLLDWDGPVSGPAAELFANLRRIRERAAVKRAAE